MKIAIDIDDTLSNTADPLFSFYSLKLGKKFKREDHIQYELHKTLNCTREESRKILNEFHQNGQLGEVLPLDYSIEAVNELKKKHELFIITSRPLQFKQTTFDWIKKHLPIKESNIIFAEDIYKEGNRKSKANICKELGINIMIEDAAHHALDCAKIGIKVILFDNPWNEKLKHKDLTRVKSWKEAMKSIEKTEKSSIKRSSKT